MALSEVILPNPNLNETVIELLNGTEALQPVVSLVDIATSGNVLSAFALAAKFHPWDYAAIGAYFISLIVIGVWSSKKSPNQGESANAYFFASRSMHWIPVGTSLFASNIGSGHFIGLAGAGANSGLSVASFEIGAMFICIILGWLFVPVYTASGVNTMPGYLRKRFGGNRIRIYLSSLSLVLYIFTKISADLYSGAIFIKQSLNLDLYSSVTVLLLISALNSIGGGLTSVMWTDAAQTLLMILGSLLLSVITLHKVGGYRQLMADFPIRSQPTEDLFVGYQCPAETTSNCTSCSAVGPYYNHIFRPSSDRDLPWPGVLFGMTILAVWYWCTDQVIVQRALSAKNVSHAKAGCILAALLKISSLFLIIIPGMAARVLWPNELGCSKEAVCKEICGSEQCSDVAYPFLVSRLMPIGANGLMMSVMMAALISSLTSIFTSASTIFTMDIYSHLRGRGKGSASAAGDTEQIIVGRLFVLALVTVSVLWIPVINASAGSQFFFYIQRVTSYLAPPVCAVYVLAVFWPRVNEPGAFWGLMAGLLLGVIRFAGDFLYPEVHCGDGLRGSDSLLKMQYLYFSIVLFAFTCLVTAFISLLTDPIDDVHLYRLTYWSKFSAEVRIDLVDEELPMVVSNGISEKRESKAGFTNYSFEGDSVIAKGDLVVVSKGADKPLPLTTKVPEPTPIWHRLLLIICCMTSFSNNKSNNRSSIQHKLSQIRRHSIFQCRSQARLNAIERAKEDALCARDDPMWRPWLNMGAVLIIVIATFIFGFYA